MRLADFRAAVRVQARERTSVEEANRRRVAGVPDCEGRLGRVEVCGQSSKAKPRKKVEAVQTVADRGVTHTHTVN